MAGSVTGGRVISRHAFRMICPRAGHPRADGHELLARGNPGQGEVDEEREQVAEQIGLREPIDFLSELRPPREP